MQSTSSFTMIVYPEVNLITVSGVACTDSIKSALITTLESSSRVTFIIHNHSFKIHSSSELNPNYNLSLNLVAFIYLK